MVPRIAFYQHNTKGIAIRCNLERFDVAQDFVTNKSQFFRTVEFLGLVDYMWR